MNKLKTLLQSKWLYIFLFTITIIYVSVYINNYSITHIYNINQKDFNITINDYKIDGNKLTIYTDNLVCNYYFKSIEEKENYSYSYNDRIKVIGTLKYPSNNTIPNTFNYKKYLHYKDIEFILDIDSISLLEKNNNILFILKNKIVTRISKIKNNEYIFSLILSNNNYIDDETYSLFSESGILYLLAFSSIYMNNYSNKVLKFLKRLKIGFKIRFILVILLNLFMIFLSGFSVSLLKALIVFIISNINKEYKLCIKRYNVLLISLFILLFINPFYLFNVSFLLSFIVSFYISFFIYYHKKFSLLTLSLVSFTSTFILIINNNYEINILSFINSFIFIPIMTYLVYPLVIICLLFPIFSVLLNVVVKILYYGLLLTSNLLSIRIIFLKPIFLEIVFYYILLFLSIRKKKYIRLIIIFIIWLYIKPIVINENSIYYLDVSQGDSALIRMNNTNILIDTGGIEKYNSEEWKNKKREYNKMKDSIIPFFKSVGVRKIDYLLITHGDYDHMGEAKTLVNNFKVEKVVFNCGEFNELELELINILNNKNIEYEKCIKELNINNNKLSFLQTREYYNENDNSNVIYTELYGYKFMFMGDASSTTEKEILSKYNIPDIDVLKVGHHGSSTSSSKEFINEINPKYSIISVGKNNRYGHPNKEVLDNLNQSKIYRTDEDGSIMFKIKNNKLKIETCSP